MSQSVPAGQETRPPRRARVYRILTVFGVVAATACAAVGVPSIAERRIPIEYIRDVPTRPSAVHPGLEWPAQIELIPDALIISPEGRESVEYHAELTVARGKSVGIAWDGEVLDDRGNVVLSGLAKGQERGSEGSVHVTAPILVDLADGFYALRVRAAIVPDDEPSTIMESIQYVELAQGKWIELTMYEWYERSRAGIAFPVEKEEEAGAAGTSGVSP
jgi:hypothetical protein